MATSEVAPPPTNPTSPKRKLRGRKWVQSNAEEVANKCKKAEKDNDESNEDKSDSDDNDNDGRLVAAPKSAQHPKHAMSQGKGVKTGSAGRKKHGKVCVDAVLHIL